MTTAETVGIVAEFNPFHSGHEYIVEKADAAVIVSVMSGNFTQRGEPASADKWSRAETAVKNGVNVVVELPTVYACNSAEFFAKGAVDVLEGFGCIDTLFFGSESGDTGKLVKIAGCLAEYEEEINVAANESLRRGVSYPKARESFLEAHLEPGELDILREPNNILALEYIKCLRNIRPATVIRRGDSYHETGSMHRSRLRKENAAFFENMDRNYFKMAAAEIFRMRECDLEKISAADRGLVNKLKKEIRFAKNTEQLIDAMKSKAYTRTRISRLLTHILLGITGDDVRAAKSYIRILAIDRTGAAFLKKVKKIGCNTVPIITNINRELDEYPEISATIKKDILASDIYNLITENNLYGCSDYIKKPFVKGMNL